MLLDPFKLLFTFMAQFMTLRRNRFFSGIAASVLLGMALCPLAAIARDDKPPASGRSSGSRGCGLAAPAAASIPSLILLNPGPQPGQTTSPAPTFAWFVRDVEPQPLVFRLYEAVGPDEYTLLKEVQGDTIKSAPGIMVYSPAQAGLKLMQGKRYRWQVELVCDPNHPSSNVFAEAELEVVAMPPALKQQLAQSRDRAQQVLLLSQNNLWYDAVSAAIKPVVTETPQFLAPVLEQVATSAVERQLLQNSAVHTLQP